MLTRPGILAQVVASVQAKLSAKEKLTPDEKDIIKPYTPDLGPAEEAKALALQLEESSPALQEIFVYYGASFVWDMTNPLGTMDADGFKAVLLETGIVPTDTKVADEIKSREHGFRKSELQQAEQKALMDAKAVAKSEARRLLNIAKANRAREAAKRANRNPTGAAGNAGLSVDNGTSIWIWPHEAWKDFPPDQMTFIEFGRCAMHTSARFASFCGSRGEAGPSRAETSRLLTSLWIGLLSLLIRLASERHCTVRGLTQRLRTLCRDRLSRHWCLDSVDHQAVGDVIKKKEMQKLLKTQVQRHTFRAHCRSHVAARGAFSTVMLRA